MKRCVTLAVLLAASVAGLSAPAAQAQAIPVTFRFLPDLGSSVISPVVRAFVPGEFNNFGPNSNGVIAPNAASLASFNSGLNEYRYTTSLQAGQAYPYKIHYHKNASGTSYEWITDPLGTEVTGPFNDSVVRVADPFVFQIAREQEGTSQVKAVSAGVFGSASVSSVTITVNTTTYTTGITHTGNGIYRLVLPTPVAPNAYVRVDAMDAQGRAASGTLGVLAPSVTDAPVPAGLEDGITYDPSDPSRAWLVLRAPGKKFVYALGDFNGWAADASSLMKRDASDPLGTRWWTEVTGLATGTEVLFQYWVDGQIRVADPYTSKVYYPGEAGYPAGATAHAVGVLTPGAKAFAWTDAGWDRPAQDELVIYELLIRDFVAEHRFTTLTDTLDYLQRLGVNAIELMPVAEFDGNESWGYNPAFHLALDKYYGTPDEFRAFVDAAHARGIAVLLDVVYNQATGQSPLIRLDNQGDFGPPTATNPWANTQARHPFNVFNDLNHESPLTRLWLDKANRWWVDQYHVDGYRYDLSKGFVQSCGGGACTDSNWSSYNATRIATLKRMADALWAAHPDTYVILEHFADTSEEVELAAHGRDQGRPGIALWSNMNDAYSEAAMSYLGNRAGFDRAYGPNQGYPFGGRVTYMESHDEQWQMYKLRAFGNQTAGYSTRALPTALDRKALTSAFFLPIPGPRMLWQFGELGYGGGPGECLADDCPAGTPGRVDNKPIRWDYWTDVAPFANGSGLSLTKTADAERQQRRDLYAATRALLDLRTRYRLFRSGETAVTGRLAGGAADRWVRLSLPGAGDGQPRQAVIVGNFGLETLSVSPDWPSTGTWYEYVADGALMVSDRTQSVSLAPGEYRIYTDVDIQSARSVDAQESPVAEAGLDAVYPNPATAGATVRFTLSAPGHARLDVYDALGRRVASPADGAYGVGTWTAPLDVSALPAGVYLVRLTTEAGAQTARLTVAR